jgi:hypothetical protein
MVSPGFDRCPSCGADITVKGDPFEHFEEAGDFVDDEEIEGKAPAAQVKRCPRCGDVVDDTMARCRRCGLPFPTRAPAPEVAAPGPPTQRTVPDFIPPEPAPAPPPEPAPPEPRPPPAAPLPAAPAPEPRPAPVKTAGPPPAAAPRPLPLPPPARTKPVHVPKVPLKSLSPDQRRTLREQFMKQGLYILAALGVADLVVWVVPLLWSNLIFNLSMCIANFAVIGYVLMRAQAHLGASASELSEYEKKRGTRVLLGLLLIFLVPFHEVIGLYPLGYTGTWSTYGGFVGMINPVLMLAGALVVAFNVQQSRERLGYFVIWRNGGLLLAFPPIFAIIQLGLPVLIFPEWFHATLGMVGGTVMVMALMIKGQREKQFSELENAMRWGDEYAARGQTEQAIAQYDAAINMAHTLFSHLIFNPDSPYAQVRVPPAYSEPWFRKGRLLARMKRTKKALAIFDMIIEMDPQNQVALLNEAELLSQSGEHEGALRAVDRVLALVPNHPDAVKLRAAVVEAGRAAAEEREKEAEAEDAESVFGTAPRRTAVPAYTAPGPGLQGIPPPVPAPEDDFETI